MANPGQSQAIEVKTVTMEYSYLGYELIEYKIVSHETRKQMWQRLRDEENRLEILAESQANNDNILSRTFLALPMTEDMKIE